METCVLIPKELSLMLRSLGDPSRPLEMGVTLWTNTTLLPGHVFRADEGQIRLDKLEVYSILKRKDVRYMFGCVDTIVDIDEQEVRHCNWVRFLQSTHSMDDVNIVASRLQGQPPTFQVVRKIAANTELKAFFDVGHLAADPEKIAEGQTLEADDSHDKENILFCRETLMVTPPNSRTPMYSSPLSPASVADEYEEDQSSSMGGGSSPEVSPPVSSNLNMKDMPLDMSTPDTSRTTNDSKSCDDLASPLQSPVEEHKRGSPSLMGGGGGGSPSDFTLDRPLPQDDDYHPVRMPLRRKEKTWLPCEVCGKKFDRPSLLKRHIRTHTGEKPHACDVCGKAFSTSSSLNTHRRIHSGEKPHQCQVCGKRFTASSNLYYHRMTHKKEKPHKCTMCSKSFPTPGDLKSHMFVHNGSWPFKCDVCNRGFSKQTNLKNHMLLHTGDKPHECPVCSKKFALQCNLRTHLKTHEDEPQEQCTRCQRSFPLGQRLLDCGVCRECTPDKGAPVGRPSNPFSIESLVSGRAGGREKSRQMTPVHGSPMDLGKSPYYANAMMAAGILPLPHYGNGNGYHGVTVHWQPGTPMAQRFGI